MLESKIRILWDHIKETDKRELPHHAGVTVLCPTWFSLVDKEGTLLSRAELDYVIQAHDMNMKVWALVDNSFNGEITHKLLSVDYKRANFIKMLIENVVYYNLDGINIDFENMRESTGPFFTIFLQELSREMRGINRELSIDVYPLSKENSVYDFSSINKLVDYVILMGYDQYSYDSPISGPICSRNYIRDSLQDMLSLVPLRKIILGASLFNRLWKEDGTGSLSYEELSLIESQEWMQYNSKELDCIYCEKKDHAQKLQMWRYDLDDLRFIEKLIIDNNVSGLALWCSSYYTSEIANEILNDKK